MLSLPLLGNTKHVALGDSCVAKIIEQHAAAAIIEVRGLQDVFRGLFLQLRRRRLRCRLMLDVLAIMLRWALDIREREEDCE